METPIKMNTESFVIYGAGGHAKVIIDLIHELGGKVECIFDDNVLESNTFFKNLPVYKYNCKLFSDAKLVIAVGNNVARQNIAKKITHYFGTLIHPSAIISPSVKIGKGTVVLAKSIIQAEVLIGEHVIVNIAACIDHESIIGDFVQIGPQVYIGGAVHIAEFCSIGPGAVVMRNQVIASEFEALPNQVI